MAQTIGSLTIALINQGLTNKEVLAGIRKVFTHGNGPDGQAGSEKTVAWYRHHLKKGSFKNQKMTDAARDRKVNSTQDGEWVISYVRRTDDQLELDI
jgi:hypothetical protein